MKKYPEMQDEDNPEWTHDMFIEAKLMKDVMPDVVAAFKNNKGRPRVESPKKHIGMRLDADVVDWLRTHAGYNALVNQTLRLAMQHEQSNGAQ